MAKINEYALIDGCGYDARKENAVKALYIPPDAHKTTFFQA